MLVSTHDENLQKLSNIILNNLGNTNPIVLQEALEFLDKLSIEIIEEAIKRGARKNKTWNYIKGTLANWVTENITTIEKLNIVEKTEPKNKDAPNKSDNVFEQIGREEGIL